jgi:acetyl-CoA synthetase
MHKTNPETWEFDIPEFFNIGTACTSRHLGTEREGATAMIIEDSDLGTDSISYLELADRSDRLAALLQAVGLEVRDRLLICLKNSLAYPISFFGALKAGVIAVPTSTLLSGSEVRYLASDSQAKAIVLSASMYRNLVPYLESLDNLGHVIVAGISTTDELEIPNGIQVYALDSVLARTDPIAQPYHSKSGEPAYLIYTSGTTGFPKGVLHSHRSLLGRMPASEYWFDFRPGDRIMHSGKFNWTYVLGSALMDPLYHGHTVIAYEGKNDPGSWVELIRKHGCTIFIGVPTIYRQIIQKTAATREDTPSLRHCMSAGEHLSSEMVAAWQERFGQDIYEAIGMSEISYYISHSLHNPIRPGSAGFVQPGHKVYLLDPETLEEVGTEEEGMICVSEDDPGLFLEYWQLEEETRKARRNGYFFTGDYARRDEDGYIWFIGRKDDIINTFGYRVSPHEIERVMKTHPKVADCVALGMDVDAGKTLVAIAVIGHEQISEQEEAEILEYGQKNLARYKCPKLIYVREEFPRTKNGKVLRQELLKELQQSSQEQEAFTPVSYRARRSLLYVPAYNLRYITKSRSLLADGVILDLEGILPEQRENARQLLREEFTDSSDFGYSERILRVNILGSSDLELDLELARELELDAILFPYMETAEQVLQARELVDGINPELAFMINIATPLGVLNVQQICAASERLCCIVAGTNQLANRMQIDIRKSTRGIVHFLNNISLAARAYGICVIDGPHYDIMDEFSCEAATKDAYHLGVDGKALVHPIQIEYINDIFTPKQEEVEKARRMLDAFDTAAREGREVIMFENELIDRVQIVWAQRMITLYDRYRELGQDKF